MKNIYCVHCADTTAHKGYVDLNGEFVFECQTDGCEAFVKFPQVSEASELEGFISAREAVNKPIAESMQATREQQFILSEVVGEGDGIDNQSTTAEEPVDEVAQKSEEEYQQEVEQAQEEQNV